MLVPACLALTLLSVTIAVRRRETPRQAAVGLAYVLVLTGLEAHYAASDVVGMALTIALGVVTLSAATRASPRVVCALMVLASIEVVALDPVSDTTLGATFIIDAGLIGICLLPAATVLGYRRQLERALAQISEIARTDPLTGLVNRRGLAELMPVMVATAARQGRSIAVLTADLDHFKRVNDEFGHAEGDAVLRDVSAAVTGCVRAHDIVARLGGEELCVVAVLEHPGTAGELGERLRKVVERDVVRQHVTVSVGGVELAPATLALSDETPAELLWRALDEADTLLYEVKEAGRNAVRVQSL